MEDFVDQRAALKQVFQVARRLLLRHVRPHPTTLWTRLPAVAKLVQLDLRRIRLFDGVLVEIRHHIKFVTVARERTGTAPIQVDGFWPLFLAPFGFFLNGGRHGVGVVGRPGALHVNSLLLLVFQLQLLLRVDRQLGFRSGGHLDWHIDWLHNEDGLLYHGFAAVPVDLPLGEALELSFADDFVGNGPLVLHFLHHVKQLTGRLLLPTVGFGDADALQLRAVKGVPKRRLDFNES